MLPTIHEEQRSQKIMNKNSNVLRDYLMKMIDQQHYWIEIESKKITELTEEIASFIEEVKIDSKDLNISHIIHQPFGELTKKLNKLSIAVERINFRKKVARDFQHELFLLKGSR
jgi:hypothetical protein